MNPIITLTMREIIDLVQFTGLAKIDCEGIGEDELETLFTIAACPVQGIKNEGEPDDALALATKPAKGEPQKD